MKPHRLTYHASALQHQASLSHPLRARALLCRTQLVWACLLLLSPLLCGCTSTTRFDFRPREERLELRGPVLLINSIQDQRVSDIRGSLLPALVPLFPEASRFDPRPETDQYLEFEPTVELRDALATLASESRAFSQVITNADDIRRRGRVLLLSVRLQRLSFEQTSNTHRVGFLAPILWLLAWPTGRIYTTLELEFDLKTSLGQEVWSSQVSQRRERLRGFYFNHDWRRSIMEDLEEILRNEWRRVLPELRPLIQEAY